MIERRAQAEVVELLSERPAVVLTGPRQVGKTTLALAVGAERSSVYLDLEDPADLAKLADPALYFGGRATELVIVDEVQRAPELLPVLRSVIDRGRRDGQSTGRFLLLGSASIDVITRAGESLAGRVGIVELCSLDLLEVGHDARTSLWLRGGLPDSLLAPSDRASLRWRTDFIRTYLERDIPALGPRIPAETMRRLWTMLAHRQGAPLNTAELARSLGLDGRTVGHYLDVLVDLLLVRRLPPIHANVGKRLVKAPRVFLRDTGIVHALLGLADLEAVLGHPITGASWEGFVVEQVAAAAGPDVDLGYYRTSGGAELDLLITWPGGERWAIEIKRNTAPKLGRGFHSAFADVKADRGFLVGDLTEPFPVTDAVTAVGVQDLLKRISDRARG